MLCCRMGGSSKTQLTCWQTRRPAQSGSMDFLARQGFDFNKWVRLWFHHAFERRAAGHAQTTSLSQPSASPNMSLQCHVATGLAQDEAPRRKAARNTTYS